MSTRRRRDRDAGGRGSTTLVDPAAQAAVRLRVERVVAGGDGLARASDGRVVFVPGALPGEVVDAHVVDRRRDFARAHTDALVVSDPQRVEPPCPFLHRGAAVATGSTPPSISNAT